MSTKFVVGGFVLGFSSGIAAVRLKNIFDTGGDSHIRQECIDKNLLKAADDILCFGAPQASPELSYHRNFVLHYDQERKIPKWVAEHITKDHMTGEAHRRNARFRPDPAVPTLFTAHNSDYLKSGWSRGHMAPAGDNKYDQDAMNETFYLSNVLPQNLDNNAGYWNRLEIYCRDLTKKFDDVYVVSGPVMMPKLQSSGGKKYISYNLIGSSEVSVPTHLYKVVLVSNNNEPTAMAAFVVPNEPIIKDEPLTHFQVPLETIEQRTGLHIHPNLDRSVTDDLCRLEGCKLQPWAEFELYMLDRKMKSAATLNRLEKILEESKRKKLTLDKQAKETYMSKKTELEDKQKMTKDGVE